MDALEFLTEGTRDFQETDTVGGFRHAAAKNTFDDIFTEAYNQMMAGSVDLMRDVNNLINNTAKVKSLKEMLLGGLKEECHQMMEAEQLDDSVNYGTHSGLYDMVSGMFDNCVDDMIKESTRVGNLLPIKAIDYPILIKQQLKLVSKDILQTEVTRTPIVKKHIEQTYVVDNKSKKRWKYPQCFFTDEFLEIYNAGKGLKIKPTKAELPLMDYDVITNCTDGGNIDKDEFTMDLKIEKVYVDDGQGKDIAVIMDPAMRINLSDNTWLGGKIDRTVKAEDGSDVVVKDLVTGMVDFVNKTVSINSVSGQVKAVEFSGYLSNEKNERTVQFDYAREEREWKIEDGFKADAPYTLEQLEDTKALMDIDLYKKTYNNLSDLLSQMEDSTALKWLDEQYEKYQGLELDPLQWNSFITESQFDCDSTSITTALPNQYIGEMLKFKIDRLLIAISDKAKMEDMTFVIYGNPNYISFLDTHVNWVTRPGSTSNGVKLDYGYGIMTSGNIKVQVVSTMKMNVKYDNQSKTHYGLRIIPYPLSKEQFTFKHFKYTTHILTSQNSAYHANVSDFPAGSQTYIVGTSRYTNAAVQGIQARMALANAEDYVIA